MITGGHPGRADAAQRLSEKTLKAGVFAIGPGTVCFAVRGCDRASPPIAQKALGCFAPRRRVPYRRSFVAAMAWSTVS